ncbi:serine hydrolase domain-containing protein [Embleya sp. NPDC020630]|uniref:serine hydrolase domain-containing protein n=1 Tax=Embleya sp. NPDC020630 TaxID=3363979 RepID=UPI003793654D
MRLFGRIFVAATAALCLTSTAVIGAASAAPAPPRSAFRCLLDQTVNPSSGPVHGAILDVTAPGIRFDGAAGKLVPGGRDQRASDTFRTSSVTKTFTATVILQLAERHRLDLDDRIGAYLDPALVDRVSVIDGVSYGSEITIRQLLDHTAGLNDYVTDPQWFDTVLAQPHKGWTPAELVDWALTHGSPYFRPGTGYHYSDTNYILAGYIIEKVTGRPLARAYRTQILDPLGMGRTYLEHWEAPRGTLSHPFLGDIDTYGFNPTNDTFGGGGLVSTAAELTTFIRALFDGRLFRHDATLRTMLTTTAQSNNTYGLGIERKVQPGGDIVWGHNGFLGAFMMYSPALRLSVTGTMNQAHPNLPLHLNAYRLAAGQAVPGCGGT